MSYDPADFMSGFEKAQEFPERFSMPKPEEPVESKKVAKPKKSQK